MVQLHSMPGPDYALLSDDMVTVLLSESCCECPIKKSDYTLVPDKP